MIEKQLNELLSKTKHTFTKNDFQLLLEKNNLKVSDTALRQRIFYLKKKGILQSVKRGVYSMEVKNDYIPVVDTFLNKVRNIFVSKYPEINYCIWSTHWLSEFMVHQPFRSFYVFETESDMIDIAFNLLKEKGCRTFLSPDLNIMQNYVVEEDKSIVIKKLITRSPLKIIKNINVPSIEKILVDIFCDNQIFYFYQGTEIEYIFNTAMKMYKVNHSLLFRYAT